MNESMKLVHFSDKDRNTNEKTSGVSFGVKEAKQAIRYHEAFPGYSQTPLADLSTLAKEVGVDGIYVKDESYRFGLNAFKGLGGSYCIGRYIANQLGIDISELSYEKITSEESKKKIGELTFVTATDGNHGRGIAWTAHILGQKAVVFMPKGSAQERLQNIRALGADASITELNYDQTVAYAAECEKKYGWVLVQDTAWDGYETIPGWIMQGYTTMAYEAVRQLGEVKPTHIFLQAGVGAMSGALTGFFADYYGKEDMPVITIVEPTKADCIYRTAEANDGTLHIVEGNMNTIMAGLACGVPCTIGWDVLSRYASNFAAIPDCIAAEGMRILGNPLGTDTRVISGESGASTFGFAMEVLRNPSYEDFKKQLKIDSNSRLLFFSTEGDTNRENYRNIVWDGKYPSHTER
ncbi:MAG: diaminopropionate ammonia-lyase [Clostridiales bacterium]|nr:diaminopropionate ammonia-lyase [Clostridiales bacterium]